MSINWTLKFPWKKSLKMNSLSLLLLSMLGHSCVWSIIVPFFPLSIHTILFNSKNTREDQFSSFLSESAMGTLGAGEFWCAQKMLKRNHGLSLLSFICQGPCLSMWSLRATPLLTKACKLCPLSFVVSLGNLSNNMYILHLWWRSTCLLTNILCLQQINQAVNQNTPRSIQIPVDNPQLVCGSESEPPKEKGTDSNTGRDSIS